jgi:hypothetical protein
VINTACGWCSLKLRNPSHAGRIHQEEQLRCINVSVLAELLCSSRMIRRLKYFPVEWSPSAAPDIARRRTAVRFSGGPTSAFSCFRISSLRRRFRKPATVAKPCGEPGRHRYTLPHGTRLPIHCAWCRRSRWLLPDCCESMRTLSGGICRHSSTRCS